MKDPRHDRRSPFYEGPKAHDIPEDKPTPAELEKEAKR